MLFTVWPQTGESGRFSIYRWAPAVTEFFPAVTEDQAREALGPDGYGILEREEVAGFVGALKDLLVEHASATGAAQEAKLSSAEIRDLAYTWLRATDPDQAGVHYYEITHAVERQGRLGGKDTVATVRSAIASAGHRFTATAPGTYTWREPPQREGPQPGATRCWAVRTDQNRRGDLWAELQAGRLRQGWGWDPEMDLEVIAERVAAREPLTEWQRQAWENRRLLTSQHDGVQVGDLVVVLHMPEHRRFSLARVTAPYQFDGGQAFGDYGHILPVRLLSGGHGISYVDERLSERLKAALGNRIRLWNLDGFGGELAELASQERGDNDDA